DYNRCPGTDSVSMTPFGDHTTEELESATYAEIDRLKTEPVTEWELQRVRNQADAQMLRSLENNMGLCRQLSNSEVLTGDWHFFLNRAKAVKAVTADDVKRVVNKYLVKSNRTVAFVTRVAGATPPPKPGAPGAINPHESN
ncbi:MAG: hypothetical protein WAU88_13205, partial [Candidatus Zixiibacteriota bacterium]